MELSRFPLDVTTASSLQVPLASPTDKIPLPWAVYHFRVMHLTNKRTGAIWDAFPRVPRRLKGAMLVAPAVDVPLTVATTPMVSALPPAVDNSVLPVPVATVPPSEVPVAVPTAGPESVVTAAVPPPAGPAPSTQAPCLTAGVACHTPRAPCRTTRAEGPGAACCSTCCYTWGACSYVHCPGSNCSYS